MIRINLAPGRGIARGGVVADLGGSCFCNGLSNQVNRLPMLLVAFMRTRPTEKTFSICQTYSWPCGGRAAAVLFRAEAREAWISVPSSGFRRLRLKRRAMSSVAEKPRAGISRKPSISFHRVDRLRVQRREGTLRSPGPRGLFGWSGRFLGNRQERNRQAPVRLRPVSFPNGATDTTGG